VRREPTSTLASRTTSPIVERFGILHRIATELRDTASIAQVAP
jgi:hypothetical protein